MKKYENKQVESKVSKESKDMTRNLCFHDWIIVRELKVLDDVYDEMLRQVNCRILDLCDIEDSDERQEKYDKILEERETLRAIYIQRRNELKAGFTDRQEREVGDSERLLKKGRYPWGPKKQTIEETANNIRHGGICYVDTDEIKTLAKDSLNSRFGCIDESAEFKGDPIVEAVLDEENMSKKPDVKFVYDGTEYLDSVICDDLVDGPEDYVKMDSWHKYTPEELKEKGIVKGTLAKGRLHPDDVGKELTPEMLNRVIWESETEGVNDGPKS